MKQALVSAVFLSLLFLVGCAANQPKSGIFQHLDDRDSISLQMALESGEDINQVDQEGRTLLHHAIRYAPHLVEAILNADPNLNVQDKDGMTALHMAVMYNPNYVAPLLLAGVDSTLKTKRKLDCRVGQHRKLIAFQTALEMASTCKRKQALSEFRRFAADTQAWTQAKNANVIGDYENYLRRFQKPIFRKQAYAAIKQLREEWAALTREQSKCEMKESGWYFIKGNCKANLAHGNGVAITIDDEKFVGEFDNGWRKKGAYSQDDVVSYDGDYYDGQQHGYGICRYDGKMEECRLYQGERIDTLFKQRENMQKQFERLSGQMEQLRGTVAASARSNGTSNNSRFGYIADLASEDDATRTGAQVQAALDIFKVLIEASK